MADKINSNIYGDITPLQYLFKKSNMDVTHDIINIFGKDPSQKYTPSDIYQCIQNKYSNITENDIVNILSYLTKQGNLKRVPSSQKSNQKPKSMKALREMEPYSLTKIGRLAHEALIKLKNMETEIKTQFNNDYFKKIKDALDLIFSNLKHVAQNNNMSKESANAVLDAMDDAQQAYEDIDASVTNLKTTHSEIHNLIANNDSDVLIHQLEEFTQRIAHYINEVFSELYDKTNIESIKDLTHELSNYQDITFKNMFTIAVKKTSNVLPIEEHKEDLYEGNVDVYMTRLKEKILGQIHIVESVEDEMEALYINVGETLKIIREMMMNKHQQQSFINQVKALKNIHSIEEAHQLFEDEFNTIEVPHFNVKKARIDDDYDLIFLDINERKKAQKPKPQKQFIMESDEDLKLKKERQKKYQENIEAFNNKVSTLFDANGELKSTYIQDEAIYSKLEKEIARATNELQETTLGQSSSNFIITIQKIKNTNKTTIIESPTRKLTTSKTIIKRKDVN